MATQRKMKMTTKSKGKKTVKKSALKAVPKKKSQINAKQVMKAKPAEAPKPVTKVHPFAQFMKGRISSHYSSAPMSKFNNHDTYRKKAV